MNCAKSPQCRIVWFLLITGALLLTSVSIYYAIAEFFTKTSHVTQVNTRSDNMLYPPLKICLEHWMSWVNWTAAEELNFTKQEVQFAMSFITVVFSEEWFNVTETEKSFYEKLAINNISLIEQFFESIAFKRKSIIKDAKGNPIAYDIFLEEFESGRLKNRPYYILCYQFCEQQMKKTLQQSNSSTEEFTLKLNLSDIVAQRKEIALWLTDSEYQAQHSFDWLLTWRKMIKKDPFVAFVFPDGYSRSKGNLMASPNQPLTGIIGAEAYTWLNKNTAPCKEGRQWIASNETCMNKCEKKLSRKLSEKEWCQSSIWSKVIHPFQTRQIYWLEDGNVTSEESNILLANETISISYLRNCNKFHNSTIRKIQYEYAQCLNTCKQEVGCEVWDFYFRYTMRKSMSNADILLTYPTGITMKKEVNLYTWDNFVSNVGGLLGIWTGASFLTIFQIVYYCCCERFDDVDEES